jgi:hypothetical protein
MPSSHLSFDWLGWVQAPARHVRQEAGPAQGGGQDVQGKVLLTWNSQNSILSLFNINNGGFSPTFRF